MKSVFIVAILIISIFANESANKISNLATQNFGTNSALEQNAFSPLSTESNMTTLNKEKTFKVQVSCPSNDAAIKATFFVSSNNTFSINIKQDTNLDKNYNNEFTIGGVDGICTNGFIKSTPTGSWSNIKYYKWVSASNGRIDYATTNKTGAGTCICTNNTCGMTFNNSIIDTVNGGIMTAITTSNRKLQIGNSKTDYTNKTFDIFLQDNTNCNKVVDNGYGDKNPNNFESQSFNTSIADVALEQGNDKYSVYSMVNEQNKVTYSDGNSKIAIPNVTDCTIKNKVNLFNGSVTLRKEDTCQNLGNNCSIYYEEICEYNGTGCLETIFKGNSKSISIDTKVLTLKENNTIYSIYANGTSIAYTDGSSTQTLINAPNSWFYIKRRYTCDKEDRNIDKNTSSDVFSNVDFDYENTFLNYKKQNGSSASLNLPEGQSCMQQFCSVRKPQNNSDVFSDGTNRDQTPGDNIVYVLDYKKCNEVSTNNYQCPVEGSEVLVEDCSCEQGMAGFAQTVGAMSALEEATKDVICSQN